jgi:HD-GYP domain-containing protein (c-di-GMP phosphodiesterase class II)
MSSDPRSADPSPEAAAGAERGLAPLLRSRGGPLVEALERHVPGARVHAQGTASYAFAAAVGVGFERAQCEVAREAAMLHEIGAIYVPAPIAAKPASERDDREAAIWDQHYEAGYRLARGAGVPEHVCGGILRARERFDGAGPERLEGERIPIESRLIRAACTCQTAPSATAAAGGPEPLAVTIEALAAQAGSELDPRVVAALTSILERAA